MPDLWWQAAHGWATIDMTRTVPGPAERWPQQTRSHSSARRLFMATPVLVGSGSSGLRSLWRSDARCGAAWPGPTGCCWCSSPPRRGQAVLRGSLYPSDRCRRGPIGATLVRSLRGEPCGPAASAPLHRPGGIRCRDAASHPAGLPPRLGGKFSINPVRRRLSAGPSSSTPSLWCGTRCRAAARGRR